PAVSETVEAEAAPAEAAPRQASLEVREAPARSWRDITAEDFGKIAYDRLPPDSGLVSPIAAPGEVPDDAVAAQLGDVQARLKNWPPARADDPVQRARNLLYVAAVPDVLQM